jgi:hypothetical protein
MNSTVLVGSQAAAGFGSPAAMLAPAASAAPTAIVVFLFMNASFFPGSR